MELIVKIVVVLVLLWLTVAYLNLRDENRWLRDALKDAQDEAHRELRARLDAEAEAKRLRARRAIVEGSEDEAEYDHVFDEQQGG